MSCHILIWFVVTVRTTSIDLFTAPAAFFFFSILWPNFKKKNFFAYHIGIFIDFQKCILYVTEGELCIYIFFNEF